MASSLNGVADVVAGFEAGQLGEDSRVGVGRLAQPGAGLLDQFLHAGGVAPGPMQRDRQAQPGAGAGADVPAAALV